MKERKSFWERIVNAADLGTEPLPKLPLVELAGHGRVLIENHLGVSQYGCKEICVKVNFGSILVCGQKLDLACMSKERLVITGQVESVRLFRGR